MTENPLNGTELQTNTEKKKEPINTPSLTGFILALGYILSSVIYWILKYIDDVTPWHIWGYLAIMFLVSYALLHAGSVVSAIGIVKSARLRNKKSLKFSIAGIAIICIVLAVNIAVVVVRAKKEARREPSWEPNTTYTEPAIWATPTPTEETFYDDDDDEDMTYAPTTMEFGAGPEKIRIWSEYGTIPRMVGQYIKQNPEFGEKYTVECTIIESGAGSYDDRLYTKLAFPDDLSPDIYVADNNVYKYTQGDMSKYAATYKELGIDVDTKIKEADIAQYSIDIGSRDGEVVALGYQGTGSVMIYNAEIAKEVFGTDDPEKIEKIVGAGTGKWDKFFEAAEKLKKKGYAAVSGPEDIWKACECSADTPWVVDGEIKIDPKREMYFDLAKTIKDNGYSNNYRSWTQNWYYNMKGEDGNKVFAYFGPAWFINYVMIGNSGGTKPGEGTYGQWRVCTPPVGFFWGDTWILANKDTDQKEGVAKIIEWITLDTSETGLQYLLANGLIDWDNDPETQTAKESVASATVMAKSDGTLEFCGGQDIFPAIIKGNKMASAKAFSPYDETINSYFTNAADEYADGTIDKDKAIEQFKKNVEEIVSF